MKLELIKNDPRYDGYMIRFIDNAVQHISTNGVIMGVNHIPCDHEHKTGSYFTINPGTYELFRVMAGMPIVGNTIGGVPFTTIDNFMWDLDLIFNMGIKNQGHMTLDSDNLALILKAFGKDRELDFQFYGNKSPLKINAGDSSVYIMGMV